MIHTHNHSVEHHSHHAINPQGVNTAFIVGIALNLLFVIIEVITGFKIHSLSLLSDAGHNLADVASLALSLLAFRLVKVKPNDEFTYGYSKTTILTALLNAVILLISIGAITYEAILRLNNPQPIEGFVISIVAAIGIVINSFTALMFFRNKEKDLNIKSAYLHLLSDAIVSFGIVIGGILIYYSGLFWIDSVLSIVIALIILISTWSLLKKSLRLSLDGVPSGISIESIKETAIKINEIYDIHHIHIWALSTTKNALTAHIVLDKNNSLNEIETIISKLKYELHHLNIQHVTLEVESNAESCETKIC